MDTSTRRSLQQKALLGFSPHSCLPWAPRGWQPWERAQGELSNPGMGPAAPALPWQHHCHAPRGGTAPRPGCRASTELLVLPPLPTGVLQLGKGNPPQKSVSFTRKVSGKITEAQNHWVGRILQDHRVQPSMNTSTNPWHCHIQYFFKHIHRW